MWSLERKIVYKKSNIEKFKNTLVLDDLILIIRNEEDLGQLKDELVKSYANVVKFDVYL